MYQTPGVYTSDELGDRHSSMYSWILTIWSSDSVQRCACIFLFILRPLPAHSHASARSSSCTSHHCIRGATAYTDSVEPFQYSVWILLVLARQCLAGSQLQASHIFAVTHLHSRHVPGSLPRTSASCHTIAGGASVAAAAAAVAAVEASLSGSSPGSSSTEKMRELSRCAPLSSVSRNVTVIGSSAKRSTCANAIGRSAPCTVGIS